MRSLISSQQRFCLSGRVFEQSYTESRLSLEAFFYCASVNGFNCVELRDSQVSPSSPTSVIESVNHLCQKYDLKVEMITARQGRLDDPQGFSRFISYLKLAKQIHCRQIKVAGHVIPLLRQAADEAAEVNIKIGTNNHVGTPWESCAGTLAMLRAIDHPNFYCHLDPSHLWCMGEEVDVEFLKTIIQQISFVIVQDYHLESTSAGIVIGHRRVKTTGLNEIGCVGYPQLVKKLQDLNCNVPLSLVFIRDVDHLDSSTMLLRSHCNQLIKYKFLDYANHKRHR